MRKALNEKSVRRILYIFPPGSGGFISEKIFLPGGKLSLMWGEGVHVCKGIKRYKQDPRNYLNITMDINQDLL